MHIPYESMPSQWRGFTYTWDKKRKKYVSSKAYEKTEDIPLTELETVI